MTRSTRTAASALRLLATLALIAAIIVLLASLLVGVVSAAPRDDIGGLDDDPVILDDDPTETPLPQPELEPDLVLTPVAIPSVVPEPTRDPFDIAVDQPDEIALPSGPSDVHLTFEVCNSPIPGQISDLWCSPDLSGYEALIYAGTLSTYTEYYFGPLPVDLFDVPAGPYLFAGEPAAPGTRLTQICRVEDSFGAFVTTLTAPEGGLTVSIGNDLVYHCTMYQLPDTELPDEIATNDGPAELRITDIWCPPGTDPALNLFGLVGRCSQRNDAKSWEASNSAGGYDHGEVIDDGVARLDLSGGAWTVTTVYPASFHPPILYCNVRDEFGNEPPAYAPFMTYPYGPNGAEIHLEQHLTWLCTSYTIPFDAGTGDDVAQVSVTNRVCPEGTQAPTVAACAETLPGVTFHLLLGTGTIIATRQTDAGGGVAFAAPDNLLTFGLAEEVPAGYQIASTASCSINGAAPADLPVDQFGIVDLGNLTGGDTVACDWFNIVDSGAPAAPKLELDVEIADAADLELAPVDATASDTGRDATDEVGGVQDEPRIEGSQDELKIENGQDEPETVAGEDEPRITGDEDIAATETPETGMVPLEADE